MRRRTKHSQITRRMVERRIDELFASITGERVMIHARTAGLIRTGKQGCLADAALTAEERATLIVVAALARGTSLTLKEITRLVEQHPGWIRKAQSAARTGEDLVLRHDFGGAMVTYVAIRNAVLRDPIIGVGEAPALKAAA